MAKYSTNSGSDSDDETDEITGTLCELCGSESDDLKRAKVAGAMLAVCPDCRPHDDAASDDESNGDRDGEGEDRVRRAIRKAHEHTNKPDSSWVEEAEYTSDRLPYLKQGYGELVREAREDDGMSQEELADKAMLGIKIIRVIENGQATGENIGRSDFERIEDVLGIDIIEEI